MYECACWTGISSDAEDNDGDSEPLQRKAPAAAPAPRRARRGCGERQNMAELPSYEIISSGSEGASAGDDDVAGPAPLQRKARAGVPAPQRALRERGARPSMAELPSDEDAASGSADASGQDGDGDAGRCDLRAPYGRIIRHQGSKKGMWPRMATIYACRAA